MHQALLPVRLAISYMVKTNEFDNSNKRQAKIKKLSKKLHHLQGGKQCLLIPDT